MSDIDIAVVDSLKALDPDRPIREADISLEATAEEAGKYVLLYEQDVEPLQRINVH